jgi:hypothetical protein
VRSHPRSKLCDVVAGAALSAAAFGGAAVGCHPGGAAQGPVTATEMPSAARQPDGVVVEPAPALPTASARAEARGVVALREPLGTVAVRALVGQMVQALEREEPSTFDSLLMTDTAYYDSGRRLPKAMLLEKWRQRMQQLDYSKLAGLEVVRPEDVQIFEYEDVGGPGEPPMPPDMQPGDLYVRAPVATPRIGTDRYFGDEFRLVLRTDEGQLKIAAYQEEDAD